MGKRGPAPQPTKLRIVRGNPSKRPLNEDEADPPKEMPECPDFIEGVGRDEWDRISIQLHDIGLLTKIDRSALAAYCASYQRWSQAEEMIRKTGTMIKSPNGYPQISPAVSIANKSMEQMMRVAKEFGMTPSSRSGIAADNKVAESDTSEAFFAQNGKK